MDRFDDITRRVSRALKTPRRLRAEQQERWEERKKFLPTYRARELLHDSRGLFTPKDELSKMDVHLARHGRLETQWRSKYPRLVIDVRAARRDLEEKIRAEGFSFLERALARRNFRATVSLLHLQGARHNYLNGTLTLNWQQKSLFRFGELKPSEEPGRGFKATGHTQAIVDEAGRQSGRNAGELRYEPRRDPRLGTQAELKRLQKAGLAEWETAGRWRLDKQLLSAKLKEASRERPLLTPGTLEILRDARWQQTKDPGFRAVTASDPATRQALGELESCYPRACRQTIKGFEINAAQLRQALYADRTRFIESWVSEHGDSRTVIQADYRLAHAVAVSWEERSIYLPDRDPKTAVTVGDRSQTVRYLRGLAMRQDQKAVRFGKGGSFLIDRHEAVALLNRHREALFAYERRMGNSEKPLAPSVVAAFAQRGKAQTDGSWLLEVNDKTDAALVWRLHQSASLNPRAITQDLNGSYRLSQESARSQALPGTPEWANRMTERHLGLKERANAIPPPAEEYLSVKLLDRDAPLTGKLAFTTEATYRRVANRQRRISLEERPRYLVQRADELSRSAWWLEHVVMRRELYAMELAAKKAGQEPLRRELNELRTGIEAMDYRALRQEENDSRFNPAKAPIPPQVLSKLKEEAKARGDQELRDAIVISEATGLRPIELSRGVKLELDGKTVSIHIQGGKRAPGTSDTEARYQVERGADRVIAVTSREVRELAERHHGYFRPVSSPDALRVRLGQVRSEIPGAENIQFYSFRNAIKNRLEWEGNTREEIAYQMGHLSTRSQEEYEIEYEVK